MKKYIHENSSTFFLWIKIHDFKMSNNKFIASSWTFHECNSWINYSRKNHELFMIISQGSVLLIIYFILFFTTLENLFFRNHLSFKKKKMTLPRIPIALGIQNSLIYSALVKATLPYSTWILICMVINLFLKHITYRYL